MESSSLNLEEMELQQMQLDERELHQKCLAGFEKLKTHLGFLRSSFNFLNTRLFEIAFRIFFREEHQTAAIEACLVTEGASLEACLVNEGITLNGNTSVTEGSGTEPANSSLKTLFRSSADENKSSDKESNSSERNDADADIGSSNDNNTLLGVYHDLFKNMFAHGIQSHEPPESISDTYEVNENNSNISSDIPNIDLDRNKEEHDYVDYEQHRAFLASLINNLKCDVEKCNEVNREAQQANALLINELDRYKKKKNILQKI
ncbi:hypothetical protein Tco_1051661 [Tanacetum coccineum]